MKRVKKSAISDAEISALVLEPPAGWDDRSIHIRTLDELLSWIGDELRHRLDDTPITFALHQQVEKFSNCLARGKLSLPLPSEQFIERGMQDPDDGSYARGSWEMLNILMCLGGYQTSLPESKPLTVEEVLLEVLFTIGPMLSTPLTAYRRVGGIVIGNDLEVRQMLPPPKFVHVELCPPRGRVFRRWRCHMGP